MNTGIKPLQKSHKATPSVKLIMAAQLCQNFGSIQGIRNTRRGRQQMGMTGLIGLHFHEFPKGNGKTNEGYVKLPSSQHSCDKNKLAAWVTGRRFGKCLAEGVAGRSHSGGWGWSLHCAAANTRFCQIPMVTSDPVT